MRPAVQRRRGVASVLGALFMVFIFMLAVGAQAYASSLQAQSAQIIQASQQVAAQKGDELALFGTASSGVALTNGGPTTLKLVGMVLEFENESVYSLNSGSSPKFTPVFIPQGADILVQNLVPNGVCKDQGNAGTATCLSKYNSIISSVVGGRAVGLLTSLGNTFWYVPATNAVKWSSITSLPPACAPGQFVSALGTTLTCGTPGIAKLCDVTLGTAASSITCSSLPAFTHYSFQYYTPDGCTGSCFSIWDPYLQFNGDTTQSYMYAEVMGSVTTPSSCSSASTTVLEITCVGNVGQTSIFAQGSIWDAQVSGGSAQVTGETVVGTSLAAFGGSWAKNVQINSITVAGSPTTMAVGTELVVWGSN